MIDSLISIVAPVKSWLPTVTSFEVLPSVSCHTWSTNFPGGTLFRTNSPAGFVTA